MSTRTMLKSAHSRKLDTVVRVMKLRSRSSRIEKSERPAAVT